MASDDHDPEYRPATRAIHPISLASRDFESLATPIYRGSTVLFDKLADVVDRRRNPEHYRYGLTGTPTARELALRIAALEGAHRSWLVPGGLAAISATYLATCKAGSHVLLPASAYPPNRELGDGLLSRFGIEVEQYDPLIGAGIAALIRPDTALIWCESPGSITMEIQDVPSIAAAAKPRGVPVALDNTYAAGVLFDAFAAGVDISLQALTKYVGGHSDMLLGSISVREPAMARTFGTTLEQLGMGVSPDDCALALRGLATLNIRLAALEQSTLEVAHWLKQRPEVKNMLHPAFPDCPGHEHWKRDFTGSASLFSIIFRDWSAAQVERFVDSLRLFKIGYSWGGVVSLVMAYPHLVRPTPEHGPRLVRLNIGLEHPADLIGDLEQAIMKANS
ncbi:MAG: cystathionine beta-lyase [Sphingomonas bacterium]|nr:cystathionine beta-lyase [Sphingomonas bacterium]